MNLYGRLEPVKLPLLNKWIKYITGLDPIWKELIKRQVTAESFTVEVLLIKIVTN